MCSSAGEGEGEGVERRTSNCDCFFGYGSFYRNKVSIFTETQKWLMDVDTRGVSDAFIANTHTHTHTRSRNTAPEGKGGELCSAPHATHVS